MKKKLLYVAIAAIVIIVLAVIFRTIGSVGQTPIISLPSPPGESGGALPDDGARALDVTTETVRSVLARLSRSESFSRSYLVTTYWEGGESEDSVNVWQKGEKVRMTITHDSILRNILILEDKLYIWYDGSSKVRITDLHEDNLLQTDRFARLISYEELMNEDEIEITDAGYIEKLGEPCIFAEYSSSENYVNRVFVSVNSGLLLASERLENGKLAVSMEAVYTDLSTPSDDIFALPG